MRVHGYCASCRRPRLVRVTGHGFALAAARHGIPEGVCSDCEEGTDRPYVIMGRRAGGANRAELSRARTLQSAVALASRAPELSVVIEQRSTNYPFRPLRHYGRDGKLS